jgi:hypothetical protein
VTDTHGRFQMPGSIIGRLESSTNAAQEEIKVCLEDMGINHEKSRGPD